jgi:enoyl-CoA hydratase/carnithine racemase
MNETVITHQRGSIFEIILNRPEKRNAFNRAMLDGIADAVNAANRAEGARVVFVRGEGKAFCAGLDATLLTTLDQTYGDHWRDRGQTIVAEAQAPFTQLERLELPTIALIHGHCLGLALELALACDLRIAAEGTLMGLPESRLGLIPDLGGTTRLTRLVGPARAKEWIFTGRVFEASLAERWGVVNYVVPADQLIAKGEELAGELSQAGQLAIGAAKRIIDGLADIDRGLIMEAMMQSQLMKTDDFAKRLDAFANRDVKSLSNLPR